MDMNDSLGSVVMSPSKSSPSKKKKSPSQKKVSSPSQRLKTQQQQQQQQQASSFADQVNDLSGLVRRKKGNNAIITTTASNAKTMGKQALSDDDNSLALASLPPPPQSIKEKRKSTPRKAGTSSTSTPNKLPNTRNTNTTTTNTSTTSTKKRKRNAITSSTNTANSGNNRHSFPKTISTSSPNNSRTERILCTLSSHSGSVLALRFSTNGKYLASAGDDSLVLLYTQKSSSSSGYNNPKSILTHGNLVSSSTSSSSPNGTTAESVENWERIHVLRGHNLDVVGLSWAPDDSHLVSCSLDSASPICVWKLHDYLNKEEEEEDGNNTYEYGNHPSSQYHRPRSHHGVSNSVILHPYKVLGKDAHTSTVKGVSFDPAGKYFASSGDDPAICIWRAFDDWGLESRIDSDSGIFRRATSKKKSTTTATGNEKDQANAADTANNNTEEEMEDIQALASLSLFRRISFAPDGSHICGTNATLRGKNIAAMISREGWGVDATATTNTSSATNSGTKSKSPPKKGRPSTTTKGSTTAAGAANLVGHKQPVVSSRHCPYLFRVPKTSGKGSAKEDESGDDDDDDDDDDENTEPNYSTLIALGDKKGFVSVWSTRKSRPIFKLQCIESKCTVTDMCWGLMPPSSNNGSSSSSLYMVISLLDGYVVALRFNVPGELGSILSEEKRQRFFRMRYGIDVSCSNDDGGRRRRLVDDKSGPKLIENVLQYTMEDDSDDPSGNQSIAGDNDKPQSDKVASKANNQLSVSTPSLPGKVNILSANSVRNTKSTKKGNGPKKADPASAAKKKSTPMSNVSRRESTNVVNEERRHSMPVRTQRVEVVTTGDTNLMTLIPPNLNQTIYTVELVTLSEELSSLEHLDNQNSVRKVMASCKNSLQKFSGSARSESTYCCTLSISCEGKVSWRDQVVGSRCTALAASSSCLIIGTFDGTIYIYGTSPSSGWSSQTAFRSHPPVVVNHSVVRLSIKKTGNDSEEMLVVTADGMFGVYSLMPCPKLQYKGHLTAPMNQMRLSTIDASRYNGIVNNIPMPKLAKVWITESGYLLLILSQAVEDKCVDGGKLQAFLYSQDMESWMRVSDDRFSFSNFYSAVPRSKLSRGLLSRLDQTVGESNNGTKLSRSGVATNRNASSIYRTNEENETNLSSEITRSHCEDRLACAMALKSKEDVRHWASLYARLLASEGDVNQIRLFVDTLVRNDTETLNGTMNGHGNKDYEANTSLPQAMEANSERNSSIWWLSSMTSTLGLSGKEIVRTIMMKEMSKNRSLQRLTNEIAMELDLMDDETSHH